MTDDGRRMPSDVKSSLCLWQGEQKIKTLEKPEGHNECMFVNITCFVLSVNVSCSVLFVNVTCYVMSVNVSCYVLFVNLTDYVLSVNVSC